MRNPNRSIHGLVVALSLALASWSGAADGSRQDNDPSLNDLSMEVSALQTIHQLDLTPAQLETLRKFAKETAPESDVREGAKARADYRRTLNALRTALVDEDDELIDQLQEELDDLRENEKPELNDSIELTNAARERAPELLRLLAPRQVAAYLGNHAEDVPEPMERLLEALGRVRDLDPKEWKQFRETISEEVGRGVAGLDLENVSQVGDKVIQLLIHARALKPEEFKMERPELEKMAREIVGNLGPLDVLRHALLQDLAELLSNPRLKAAVDARLKKETGNPSP
ncbi:MAG TPA: hypothetical protein VKU02_14310 [Gemmataceae bacterium]|nr:hypothetical protein [Gemmataceae bacterium]